MLRAFTPSLAGAALLVRTAALAQAPASGNAGALELASRAISMFVGSLQARRGGAGD